MNEQPWKPTRQQLSDALGKTVPDVIEMNLKVLFCGINPSLYTAAVGHHFARPGNRFWPVLWKSGFTPDILSPFDERELLRFGYGITNVVNRATAAASDLSKEEIQRGGKVLITKVLQYRPKILAVCGVGAYREIFKTAEVKIGRQDQMIETTTLWVLPNPSGLNANYQIDKLVELFRELYDFVNNL
jgi:TDG/mug DNA glycosylase family protein